MRYDIRQRFAALTKVAGKDVLSVELALQVIEREVRLDEANDIDRLLVRCCSLSAALSVLRMHIKALVR